VLQEIKQFRKDFYNALYHCQQTEGDAPEFFTLENDNFLIQKAKIDDEERVYRGYFKTREQYFLIKSTFDPNREIETLSYFKTDEDYSNPIFWDKRNCKQVLGLKMTIWKILESISLMES
jgi:hypothetical protein